MASGSIPAPIGVSTQSRAHGVHTDAHGGVVHGGFMPGPALLGDGGFNTHWRATITAEPTNAREAFGDLAPKLAYLTDNALLGNVWRTRRSCRASQPSDPHQPHLALPNQRAAVPWKGHGPAHQRELRLSCPRDRRAPRVVPAHAVNAGLATPRTRSGLHPNKLADVEQRWLVGAHAQRRRRLRQRPPRAALVALDAGKGGEPRVAFRCDVDDAEGVSEVAIAVSYGTFLKRMVPPHPPATRRSSERSASRRRRSATVSNGRPSTRPSTARCSNDGGQIASTGQSALTTGRAGSGSTWRPLRQPRPRWTDVRSETNPSSRTRPPTWREAAGPSQTMRPDPRCR